MAKWFQPHTELVELWHCFCQISRTEQSMDPMTSWCLRFQLPLDPTHGLEQKPYILFMQTFVSVWICFLVLASNNQPLLRFRFRISTVRSTGTWFRNQFSAQAIFCVEVRIAFAVFFDAFVHTAIYCPTTRWPQFPMLYLYISAHHLGILDVKFNLMLYTTATYCNDK